MHLLPSLPNFLVWGKLQSRSDWIEQKCSEAIPKDDPCIKLSICSHHSRLHHQVQENRNWETAQARDFLSRRFYQNFFILLQFNKRQNFRFWVLTDVEEAITEFSFRTFDWNFRTDYISQDIWFFFWKEQLEKILPLKISWEET